MRNVLAALCLSLSLAGPGIAVEGEVPAEPSVVEAAAEAPAAGAAVAGPGAPEAEPSAPAEAESGAVAEFVDLLAKGGTTVLILLILSVIGISYGIERMVRLRRVAIVPPGLADELRELGKQGDWATVRARCEAASSTLSRIVRMLLEHRQESKREVSTMAGDIARRELKGHLQRCYPLAVVATIAPLLGLFGTVYGMIGAFATVASVGSMGDPSVLADDISKALVTTAVGLAVAIPALVLYHFFKYKVQIFATALEEDATELIADWYRSDSRDADQAQVPNSEAPAEVQHAG